MGNESPAQCTNAMQRVKQQVCLSVIGGKPLLRRGFLKLRHTRFVDLSIGSFFAVSKEGAQQLPYKGKEEANQMSWILRTHNGQSKNSTKKPLRSGSLVLRSTLSTFNAEKSFSKQKTPNGAERLRKASKEVEPV